MILSIPSENTQIKLKKDCYLIGRGSSCDIIISDEQISRMHAFLRKDSKDWTISDCGSKNGTFVNDKRISGEPVLIHEWDRIFLSDVPIQLRAKSETQARTSTRPVNDQILDYLQNLDMLDEADEIFTVQIELEGRDRFAVELYGSDMAHDAINKVLEMGYHWPGSVHFVDWPGADPCWGPDYHHVSACVCELENKRVYHLESFNRDDFRMLYGCPNPSSIRYMDLFDRMTMQEVEYG